MEGLRTLERFTQGDVESSARPALWRGGDGMGQRATPLGVGTGGFTLAAGYGERRGLYPHNHLLEAWAEGGLPGLLFWLLCFGGAALVPLLRLRRMAAGEAGARGRPGAAGGDGGDGVHRSRQPDGLVRPGSGAVYGGCGAACMIGLASGRWISWGRGRRWCCCRPCCCWWRWRWRSALGRPVLFRQEAGWAWRGALHADQVPQHAGWAGG
jgi:O-antigen ligase